MARALCQGLGQQEHELSNFFVANQLDEPAIGASVIKGGGMEVHDVIRRGISQTALCLQESITHGTRARIAQLNEGVAEGEEIIDLSIGTLDEPADHRIDQGVCDFIKQDPNTIHAFAPVKGFSFLLEAVATKLSRMHVFQYDPKSEIMITPGGIKGAITVIFHTLLNAGDDVIIPVPNWPHYGDMVNLHGANVQYVQTLDFLNKGLTADELENAISDTTKLIILGDCINPTGKVYSTQELEALATVIAQNNEMRETRGLPPIYVLFDCPYEAYITGQRAKTLASFDVPLGNHRKYAMHQCTILVTGPGKTYGMHGDRIGYICTSPDILKIAERVQVNLNSFASTYGQIATYVAVQEEMDAVIAERAADSKYRLQHVYHLLTDIPDLGLHMPEGGYFLFLDFSRYATRYQAKGYAKADAFLLNDARVAMIGGYHFSGNMDGFTHYVRMNCGRSMDLLDKAVERIESAITQLEHIR